MQTSRVFSLVLSFSLVLTLLTAGMAAGEVTITVMHQSNELSPENIAQFEAENPGIKVEMIEMDMNTLMSRVAAGSPPNLTRAQSQDLPYFAVRGLLLPIDDYLAQSAIIKADDLESPVNSFRYDVEKKIQGEGALYGFPKDYSVLFDFFYRKDIFTEVGIPLPSLTEPLSYDEFYKICEKLVVREGDRTVRWAYDGALAGSPEMVLDMFLAQKGLSLYQDDMKHVNLTGNPEAMQIVRYMFDMALNRLVASAIDPSDVWLGGNLADEKPRSAIYQYGYWAGAMYNKPEVVDKFGYAPGPIWNGGERWCGGNVTGMVMFDSGNQELNDAAWKFMEFYNAGQPAVDRAKSGWGLPMLKSMRALVPQENQLDKDRLAVTLAQLDSGKYHVFQGNPWALTPVQNVWNTYIGEALAGNMTFEDFIATVEAEANNLLLDGASTVE